MKPLYFSSLEVSEEFPSSYIEKTQSLLDVRQESLEDWKALSEGLLSKGTCYMPCSCVFMAQGEKLCAMGEV